MGKRIISSLPQILGFTTISPEGKFKLKKTVLNYFGFNNLQVLYLDSKNELLLTTNKMGVRLSVLPNNWLVLPGNTRENLQLKGKTNICFIQRQNGVAVKRFKMTVKKSKRPRIVDIESSHLVTRRIETFSEPIDLLDDLKKNQVNYNLNFDVANYWKGKKSFSAWKVRQLLDIEEESDEELLRVLIQDRLSKQLDNGSWDELVTATAKNLKELADLGMNSNYPQIQKAIKWLLARPQSPHNPGMFFLSDELVDEQLEIMEQRRQHVSGPKERFRKRPRSELKIIQAVDELFDNACGPRIMWPNAIVLESLLEYGFEFNDRVQTIIDTLSYGGWCECAYQHGPSRGRTDPLTMKELEEFEKQTLFEFKHGGLHNFKLLMLQPTWSHLMRLSHKKKGDNVEYSLRMPTHTQGCELITTGALSKVTNEKLWRLAESHLWRFVVALFNAYNNPYGMDELIKYSLSPYSFLNVFSKYSTKAAPQLGILLSLPWIIENQNEDGTWGNQSTNESATLAVLNALKNIEFI